MENINKHRIITIILALIIAISASLFIGTNITLADTILSIEGNEGLSISYTTPQNGSAKWTVSGNNITGNATGYKGGFLNLSSYRSDTTITFKNDSDSSAILSFVLDKNGINGGTLDKEPTEADGKTYRVVLGKGGTDSLKLTSPSGKKTATVVLSNVTLEKPKIVYTTFTTSVGGSFTVDGTTITSSTTLSKNSTENYQLVATAISGYKFYGWFNEKNECISYKASASFVFNEAHTIHPVFIERDTPVFGVGSKKFISLTEANAYALAGTEGNIIALLDSGTLPSGNYAISSGVTLLIPFDEANTLYTSGENGAPICVDSKDLYDPPQKYRELTLAKDAVLNVNGALSLSAKCAPVQGSKIQGMMPSGPCPFIKMEKGSNIYINDGGTAYVYGFIYGEGNFTARTGAKVYESMQLAEFRGGNLTTDMHNSNESNGHKVLPFSQYYVQNIEAECVFEYGSQGIVLFKMRMEVPVLGVIDKLAEITFIGKDDGLLRIKNSSSSVKRKYLPKRDRIEYTFSGNVDIENIVIPIGINLMVINIPDLYTEKYNFPINGNMSFVFNEGAVSTINQDIALLPGSEIIVENGATLTIAEGKELILYDWDQWKENYYVHPAKYFETVYYSPSREYTRTYEDLVDAKIDVKGTIICNGYIYTTNGGANISSSQDSLGDDKTVGTIIFNSGKGTRTITKQFIQDAFKPGLNGIPESDSSVKETYPSIPITAPKLLNGDKTYTETTNMQPGATYCWNPLKKKWVTSGSIEYNSNKIHANGEPITGEPEVYNIAATEIANGNYGTVSSSGYQTEHYEFKGWKTVSDGDASTVIPAGTTITKNHSEIVEKLELGQDIVLYAHWEAKEYEVSWDTDGDGEPNYTEKLKYAEDLTEPTPSKDLDSDTEEYVFKCWNTTPNHDVPQNVVIDTVTGNTTYYAYFEKEAKKYDVTFDIGEGATLDGKAGPTIVKKFKCNTEFGTAFTNPVRDGFTFIKWIDVNGTEVSSSDTMPVGTLRLTAVWKETNKWTDNRDSLTVKEWTYGDSPEGKIEKDSLFGDVTIQYYYEGDWHTEAPINAGTYRVRAVVFAGENDPYTGLETPQQEFTIKPASPTIQFAVDVDDFVYNGSSFEPTIIVKGINGETLVEGTDYRDIVYSNNINAGTATVKITGINNYNVGEVKKEFVIEKADDGWTADGQVTVSEEYEYGSTVINPTATAKSGSIVSFTYYHDSECKTPVNPENPKEAPTNVGSYFVKAYVNEGKNYKEFCQLIPFKITKATNKITNFAMEPNNWTYGEDAIEPSAVAKIGQVQFKYYKNGVELDGMPTDAGTYTVVAYVVETTNYDGAVSEPLEFTINKAKVEDDKNVAISINNLKYDSKEHTITVTTGLKLNVDYTLTIEGDLINVTDAGIKVTVTGINNYEGTVTETFKLEKINDGWVDGNFQMPGWVYGQSKIGPNETTHSGTVPTYTYYTDSQHTNEIEFEDITTVGTYYVKAVVEDSQNYNGFTAYTSFNVAKATNGLKSFDVQSWTYDGTHHAPTAESISGDTVEFRFFTDEQCGATSEVQNPIDAGIYYVKAYVAATTNYEAYESESPIVFVIGKTNDAPTSELTIEGWTYGEEPNVPTITTVSGTRATYTYYTDPECTIPVNAEQPGEVPTNAGTYYVKATVADSKNHKGFETSKSFTIAKANIESAEIKNHISLPEDEFVYTGSDIEPAVTIGAGLTVDDYDITYQNNKNVGPATVTIKGTGNYEGEIVLPFTITQKALEQSNVTLSNDTFTYNKGEQTPTVTVKVGETALALTTDYTVEYQADVTNVGTKTVTVTGTGNYTGTVTKTYSITAANLTNAVLANPSEVFTFDGNAKTPAVVVNGVDNEELSLTDDYTVSYADNKNAGTATITITGKGNYTGTKTVEFQIGKATNEVELSMEDWTYREEAKEPVAEAKDGEVKYEYFDKDGNKLNAKPSNAGEYYVKAVVEESDNYNAYTDGELVPFTIAQADITDYEEHVSLPVTSFVYTGQQIRPEVLIDELAGLVNGDYEIIYGENINVVNPMSRANESAKAIVTVRGIGNYKNEIVLEFAITPKPLEDDDVSLSNSIFTYDENVHKPEATVTVGETTLVKDTDYTVTYLDDCVTVGTKRVEITGKGNYTGSVTKTFKIEAANLTSAVLANPSEVFTFDGNAKTTTVVVIGVNNSELVLNTDYEVAYKDNTNAGTATITITGKGNYTGTKTVTFTINPAELPEIKLEYTTTNHTGQAKEPKVVNENLVKDRDYEVTYTDNINVGTATVTVVGKGNYAGTKTATFQITQNGLDADNITLSQDKFTFDGTNKIPTVTVKGLNDTVLTEGTDYELKYENNLNAGTAKVTITGKGTYSGEIVKYFTINKAELPTASLPTDVTYTYNGEEHKPTVSVGNLVLGTDYTVTYDNNTDAGVATVTVKPTENGNYKGEPQVLTFTIGKAHLPTITIAQNSFVYNGQQHFVTVTNEGLTANDYDMLYSPNTNVGTVSIIITGRGNYEGSQTITFTITQADNSISLSMNDVVYGTRDFNPTATATAGTITYKYYIANSSQEVEMTDATPVGEYYVVATAAETDNYKAITSDPVYFNIVQAQLPTADKVTLSKDSVVYTGEAIEPTVTIDGLTTDDFDVSYTNNINVGKATVTITGKGNYTGSLAVNFDITEANIADLKGKATVDSTPLVYDGNAKTPSVTVEGLTAGTDFTVSYTDNTNAGTATVTVTGKGNYSGSFELTFNIAKAQLPSATLDNAPLVYDGSAKEPAVTVGNLVARIDYTVEYKDNIAAGEGTASVTVKGIGNYEGEETINFTIAKATNAWKEDKKPAMEGWTYGDTTKVPTGEAVVMDGATVEYKYYADASGQNEIALPTDADTYYARIIVKLANYNDLVSTPMAFTIAPKEIKEANLSFEAKTYTGEELKPVVTIEGLEEGRDFTVKYPADVKNAGDKEVTIKGIGNYTGTVTKTYKINKAANTWTTELTIADITYGKANPMPNAVSAQGAVTYKYYEDAECKNELTITATTPVGKYYVVATAAETQNYLGLVSDPVEFNIKAAQLPSATLDNAPLVYDGSAKEPAVTVGNLVAGTDYKVEYMDNIAAGENTASVTVKGIGNYEGEETINFTIAKATNKWTAELKMESWTYGETANAPIATAKVGTVVFKYYSDPACRTEIEAPTNAGTYYVRATVTVDNYNDLVSDTKVFTIARATIKDATLVDKVTYTGEYLEPTVTIEGLEEGKDFTVTYSNNQNVGTANVRIQGIVNYTGVINKTFVIENADNNWISELKMEGWTFGETAKKPTAEAKVGDVVFKYYSDEECKNEIAVPSNAGTYYVKAFVTAVNYNNLESEAVKFVVEQAVIEDADVSIEYDKVVYDTYIKEPKVTVGGLTKELDYDVVYNANRDAGTATVTVVGKGNYKGTVVKEFTIEQATNTWVENLRMDSWTFGQTAQTPISRPLGGVVVYTYYSDAACIEVLTERPTDAGTYYVKATVEETNNYSALESGVVEFTIAKAKITYATLEFTEETYTGEEIKPTVTIGNLVEGKDFEVHYEDNVNAGEATVTINGIGNYEGTVHKTFKINKAPNAWMTQLNLEGWTYGTTPNTPKAVAKDGEVTYKYFLNSGCTIEATGIPKKVGIYYVKAYVAETNNYLALESEPVRYTITVNTITDATLEYTEVEYTGKAHEPKVTIEGLTEGTDFTVKYNNNVNTGEGAVIITGVDNCTGVVEKRFTIKKASNSWLEDVEITGWAYGETPVQPTAKAEFGEVFFEYYADAEGYRPIVELTNVDTYYVRAVVAEGDNHLGIRTALKEFSITRADIAGVTLEYTEAVYTGSKLEPVVTVTRADGTELTADIDYSVVYENNEEVGQATVTVTGKNNYKGTITKTFDITQADNAWVENLKITEWTYGEEPNTPTAKPLGGDVTFKFFTDKECTQEVQLTNTTDAGVYYVKAYVSESRNYKAMESDSLLFVIGFKKISGAVLEYDEAIYTGEEFTPTVTIEGLTEGTDFTVEYSNNKNAGTATVTVRGIGNYANMESKTFKILPNPNKWTEELTIVGWTYGEEAKDPNAESAFGDVTYKYFTDAECTDEIDAPEKAGTYYVKAYASGADNYKAIESDAVEFTIATAKLPAVNVEFEQAVFTGEAIKPEVTIEGLVLGTDFEVTYKDNTNAGTATITITGLGNYDDVVTKNFEITKAPNSWTSELAIEGWTFGKNANDPSATAKFGEATYKYFSDEACQNEIELPVAAGTYYVKAFVAGTANYEGLTSDAVAFTIARKALTAAELEYEYTYYTGSELMPAVTINGLTEGEDFQVEYADNVNTGTATVTITGLGNYRGTIEETFDILQAPNEFTSELAIEGWEFTDEPNQPTVTTKFGEATFQFFADEDCIETVVSFDYAGTYYVKAFVEDTANYVGLESEPVKFVVAPKTLTEATLEFEEVTYTGQTYKPAVTVGDLVEGEDYRVTYENNTSAGTATVTIFGMGNYAGTVEKTFEIKQATNSWTSELTMDGWTYGDNAKAPSAAATFGAVTYKYFADADCTLEIERPEAAGTYYVKAYVKETTNFTGLESDAAEFAIAPKTLTYANIEFTTIDYTGKEIKPEVSISGLTLGRDFELVYENNVNVGTATVTITGKGNYEGTLTKEFEITKSTNIWTSELVMEGWTYGDRAKSPSAEAKFGEVIFKYFKDAECTEEIEAPEVAGTYYVKAFVEETTNYYGLESEAVKYVIEKATITDAQITITEATYTGKAIEPKVFVLGLTEGEDFEVVYEDNVNVGEATVTIKGIGSYDGEVVKTFQIKKATNEWLTPLTIEGWTFGESANEPVAEALVGEVIFKYFLDAECTVEVNAPSTAKKYYVKAYVIETENYTGLETEAVMFEVVSNYFEEDYEITRVFGPNRYETALEIADSILVTQGVSKFGTIIVASGTTYADALPGSYLAEVEDAPILLVDNSHEGAINDYIKANLSETGTVYILGGTGVVSQKFENDVKASMPGAEVIRLGGTNRYETNLEILMEAGVPAGQILVCSGNGYADSLSASATGLPIMLVGDSLTESQKVYLNAINNLDFSIIGGSGAVSDNAMTEIDQYGDVERVFGQNRYETSVAVAKRFFPSQVNVITLAYGLNFPDGLAGGPLSMSVEGPLLLIAPGNTSYAKEYVDYVGATRAVVFGGTALLDNPTVAEVMN